MYRGILRGLHPMLAAALLLGAAVGPWPADAAPGGKVMVTDGDFERKDLQWTKGHVPGAWEPMMHGQNDAAFTLVDGQGRNGSRCAAYRRTTPGSDNAHLDQVVAVEPNQIYELTAWVRGDGTLRPLLAAVGMDWKILATVAAPAGTEWQQVRLIFPTYSYTSVRLEWFGGSAGSLYQGGPGTSYLDDLSLAPVSSISPELRLAYEIQRPRIGEEIDLRAVRTGRVGRHTPLRPITCRDGVLRYDDGSEVALWGVNFQTALSWEYQARLSKCGLSEDIETLKRVTDQSLDEVIRMGVNVVRLHLLPEDFTDGEGHLRDTLYLDALDYLLARCRERGVYAYITLINQMNAGYCRDSFLNGRDRREWMVNEEVITKSERYMRELLAHENRYSRTRYQDDVTIAVWEIANEPSYVDYGTLTNEPAFAPLRAEFQRWVGAAENPSVLYPAFRYQRTKEYLDRICRTLRATGSRKPIIWNCNWPRMINGREDVFQAIADSSVDGVSFCFYPGQDRVPSPYWANPRDLSEINFLPFVQDNYKEYLRLRWLLGKRFAGKAKLVYEFEQFYNQSSYLYPDMARLFRAMGAQMATMWTYALAPAAEYMSGSHHLNLLCTPEKAASFLVAGEVFANTPRYTAYDATSDEERVFAGGAVSYSRNLSLFSTPDRLLYSRSLDWTPIPIHPGVRRIVGTGSSPLVSYGGTGIYFVEVGEKEIALTINPDAKFILPPWERRRPARWDRVCQLDSATPHRMELKLPGWQAASVWRVENGARKPVPRLGDTLAFEALPGQYVITR